MWKRWQKSWLARCFTDRASVSSIASSVNSSISQNGSNATHDKGNSPLHLHAEQASNAGFYGQRLLGRQIRVLRIEPGVAESPLHCRLEVINLLPDEEEAPDSAARRSYEAISYCWGSGEIRETIFLNDQAGFKLSMHLLNALYRLRRPLDTRYVWIDAICINQSDDAERSSQVDQMYQIFGQARHVIIWLGEINGGSWRQATCKCHVPHGLTNSDQAVCAEPGLSAFEHGGMGKVIRDKLHADERRSWRANHLGQVWWKRLWVVQELAAARDLPTVCIGPHTISWAFFTERLWSKGENHLFRHLRKPQARTLRGLLLSTANDFYCSEPRDWIFALLGLVDDPDKPRPDYSKPVAKVYEEAMVYMMNKERSVDVVLDDRTNREWSGAQYASYIPRFRNMRDPISIKTVDHFRAGYNRPKIALVPHAAVGILCKCTSNHALSIRAIPFDNVHHKVDMFKLAHVTSVSKELLKQVKIDFKAPRRHLVDRAPNIGYLMLEFICSGSISVLEIFERAQSEIMGVHGLHYIPRMHYAEQLSQDYGFTYTRETQLDLAIAQTFENEFQRILKLEDTDGGVRTFKNKLGTYRVPVSGQKRCFFSTQSGYMGIGSASLEVGDSIIVPFGSSRPLIVRSHGGHYVLVGDAVVPGIMSGQLVNLHAAGTIQDDDFYLK